MLSSTAASHSSRAADTGKTTEWRLLAQLEAHARFVNAAPLTRQDLTPKIAAAAATRVPVYLDGPNQAALHDPRLLQWLEEKLPTPEARQVPWPSRVPAGGKGSIADRDSQSRAAEVQRVKLLPLDRDSAEAVVTSRGYDGRSFIHAVIVAGLGRLSASVGRLLAAAAY
jgi:hypothetical protein